MPPKWCDLGSIVPPNNFNPFLGVEEFSGRTYPLLPVPATAAPKSPCLGEPARSAATTGITHALARLLLPDLNLSLSSDRKALVSALLKFVENLQFSEQATAWSDYHPIQEFQPDIPGHQVFFHIFKAIQPQKVVDLGANAGFFSRYMASQGAEVLAVEPDETAVMHRHRRLRVTKCIYPLKLLLAPVGQADCRPGDLAVALALPHHLFFYRTLPLEIYLVKLLASYTTQNLLAEYRNGLPYPLAYPPGTLCGLNTTCPRCKPRALDAPAQLNK